MADRYDPNSQENLDKFDGAADPSSDTWASLVTHITGYPVPDRTTVFDTLRSDHGGKLFRMDIKERSLGLLVKDSGFLTNTGEDYDIWFFDSGKKSSIKQARIVFEGRVKAGDEIIFAGPGSDNVNDAQVREGNEFTDYNKDKMSTVALARYMNGPRAALMELLRGSTADARFSNLGVPGADVVDLKSFDTTGESFDFAAKFFRDHAVVLKDWEDRFSREDASWKGEAAEVFRSLLKKVRENYDNYVETFDSSAGTGDEAGTGGTVYSRALSLGRGYLEDSATKLLEAWLDWANSSYYDPHQVLRYVLDELAQWVDANNVAKTDIKSYTSRYSTTVTHSPQAGFTQTHPEYGDLNDIANWAKVGDKAAKIWTQGVDEYLGKPAATVQSALNNHFLELGEDFSDNVPKPKSTSTASEEYEEKKLEEEKEEIKKENEENKRYQDELREEQNKQREEDKKYQDELREEQRLQREEDKRLQDELREEQNKQREEDKQYQDELREEQKQEQEEAKRLQDELRNEQNQQRDEDKQYAENLREEQKQEQEEAKREAEAQQKAVTESLGGLNDPNAVTTQDLGNLDSLLNEKPVTESPGNLNLGGGEDNQQGPATVAQNLGNLGSLNNGPAGSNKSLNDANQAITQDLGNLGGLNDRNGASLDTPTGGNSRLDGNGLTTDFPDGSSSTFDPDSGTVTTTHPDGSITTQNLGDGTRVTNPDGSVTSLGDDGKLTTTFPDGSTQVVDPSTGQAVTTDPDGRTTTQDLGNLGNLNGGNSASLDTPTGGSSRFDGDDLTTRFPDGSSSTFDPDSGTVTTTLPDGSVTTQNLGDGTQLTNPDGSVTSLGDDGKLTTTFPDGSTQVVDPSTGQAVTTDPDGRTTTQNLGNLGGLNGGNDGNGLADLQRIGDLNTESPGDLGRLDDLGDLGNLNADASGLETPTGGHTSLVNDDFATTFSDGSKGVFDPDTGSFTLTSPDGSSVTTDLTHGATVTNPDGSTTRLDNGQLTNSFPDGSKQIIDPETGIATVTDPQGRTETIDLHDLNTGGRDTSSILDDLTRSNGLGNLGDLNTSNGIGDLGGGGGGGTTTDVPLSDLNLDTNQTATSALGGGLSDNGSLGPGSNGVVDPLGDSSTDGTATPPGSQAPPGSPGAPGTPGSPGMPMGGGMGGMGAGGGEKGNGERVRSVLVDAAEESQRRNRRRRSPWNRQEDSDTFLAPAPRVATTGGNDTSEEETEPSRRTTTSADFLEEDADVWGTEEGGTPSVIGR